MTTAQNNMLDRHGYRLGYSNGCLDALTDEIQRLCMRAFNEPLTEEIMPRDDTFYEYARDICQPSQTIRIEDIFGNPVLPKRDLVVDFITRILEIERHLCAVYEQLEHGAIQNFPDDAILRLARREIIEVARELLGAAQEIT
jgi:hypothetical protein